MMKHILYLVGGLVCIVIVAGLFAVLAGVTVLIKDAVGSIQGAIGVMVALGAVCYVLGYLMLRDKE